MNVYIGQPIVVSDMQGPAPEGFHVPLITEWQGLQTIMSGLGLTTGDNWRVNLHIPFAGYRSNYADIGSQGSIGYYWSSSPYGSDYPHTAFATVLDASSSVNTRNGNKHTFGFSVRCFKNSFELPTSSWTVINGTLGGAGIFRDTVNGLISITSDGTTGYTIQDKNLGATAVYNDGDTLSAANCGKYYQRGNNYGFAWTGSVTTSSTQVNASSYGPGNYYSSSTFITGNNWDSSNNPNLRGGVSQGSTTKDVELKNAYIGEYKGWKPDANTFGYYTFDDQNASQITDFSGNNRNLTGGTMPTYTLVSGTNYAGNYTNVSGSVAQSVSYATLGEDFSMLMRVKITTSSSCYLSAIYGEDSGTKHQISIIYGYNSGQIEYYDSLGGVNFTRTTIKSGATTNVWYLVGFVRNNGVLYTYCNGIAGNTGSYQVSNVAKALYLGCSNLGDRFKGQIGECVVENKVRTAQEISDYYNLTKSNYGL